MYIIKKIPLSPYVVDLWIIITDTPLIDIPKLNKKHPGLAITWDAQTAAWTNDHFYDDNTLAVVFETKSFDPDVVAHETVHVVNRTYEHAGANLDTKNDEPQAYLTGWIVGEIHKAYAAFIKKKQKSKI